MTLNKEDIKAIVGLVCITGIFLIFLWAMAGCSVAIPVKGGAKIDTSGTQTVSGKVETDVNITITMDMASQIKQICTGQPDFDTCRTQVIQIYQATLDAVNAAIAAQPKGTTT